MEASKKGLESWLSRRRFLVGACKAIPVFYTGWTAMSFASETSSADQNNDRMPGRIARQRRPDNLEFPFSTLRSFLTPNHRFYVRTHFEIPTADVPSWRLRIDGAVRHPLSLTYEDLRAMPSTTLTALLECSGNGRVFLDPPQTSIRWELGGVSNAEWTGVRLSDVLARAGVREEAVEVILEGADKGALDDPDPKTPGPIPYARSLPLQKATRPEVILAYRMNGEDLPPEHGFPVRAVVAGWYGMASVKWLHRVIVADRPFDGYFQTFMYSVWERRHGLPTLVPVSDIAVKSEIARPAFHDIVPAGSTYQVIGAAWAGESDVVNVEFSPDGGASWHPTKLLGEAIPFAWRFWQYEWRTPSQRATLTLMARATDSRGRAQPLERDEDRRDAMISHVLPLEVYVR